MVVQGAAVGILLYVAYSAVVAGIVAVHVAGQAAAQESVEETGVELGLVGLVRALDHDAAQSLFPDAVGFPTGLVEGQVFSLGHEVVLSVVDGGVGYPDLDLYGLVLHCRECHVDAGAGSHAAGCRGLDSLTGERAPFLWTAADLSIEIQWHHGTGLILLDVCRFGYHAALKGTVPVVLHLGVHYPAALAPAAPDVEYQVSLVRGRKRIAVKADPLSGRQLCPDAVILEYDGVISRRGIFVLLVELRAVAVLSTVQAARNGLESACGRHHRDTSYLKLMQVDKTLDRGMAGIVAHGLPAVLVAIMAVGRGRHLRHAEWQGGRSVEKPAAVRSADVWIHVTGQALPAGVLRLLSRCRCG